MAWLVAQGVEGAPKNESGNTPLHWAVQNQHERVVRLLLDKLENVDVLVRNGFGKSVLTEGFLGKNQEILKLLLEHSSADEDALMGGGGMEGADMQVVVEDENENDNEDAQGQAAGEVVHRLVLDRAQDPGRVLQIREVAIKHADDPFGQAAADDTTGLGVWAASLVLARWLVTQRHEAMEDATVVELGCGCAVPGLAVALHARPKAMYLTDLNPETLANARGNVALNAEQFLRPEMAGNIQVTAMDWGDEGAWPVALGTVDVVLGSDLVYQQSLAPLLSQVLQRLLRPGGRFLYVAPETGRDGLDDFLGGLPQRAGLTLVSKEVAGPELLANPLEGGHAEQQEEEEDQERADEAFFVHFHELATQEVTYILYEYVKQA